MSGQHILIIDDQRLDRAIATHAAVRVGFAATGAATLSETRRLFETETHFDFILLDLSLGAENGLDVLPLIAQFDPTAVLVLASGFDGRILAASQRLASSLGLRVAGVLRKPILPTALQRILRQQPAAAKSKRNAARTMAPEEIRRAIASGEIRPWFQPKVALAVGHIVGAEALARWLHPDGRMILPEAFVDIAERAGLMPELTDSMLDKALAACAAWREFRPDCWVAVNVSPLMLDDPDLIERVDAVLERHAVPPGALVLEITETNGVPDTPRATEILTKLRIRGVNLSVDDFGTGHSGLLSLARLPFNEMKIDQAFVREALTNRDSRKIVRASASLGRELGLSVVAEGVETESIARLVSDAGCEIGQGWLFGHAMPADAFIALLRRDPINDEHVDSAATPVG